MKFFMTKEILAMDYKIGIFKNWVLIASYSSHWFVVPSPVAPRGSINLGRVVKG